MKRFTIIVLFFIASLPCWAGVCDTTMVYRPGFIPTVTVPRLRVNEGMIRMLNGDNVRMYCDFVLPEMTSNLLVDVGMMMSQWQWSRPLSAAPRWFTMFSPTALQTDEFLGTVRCNTSVSIRMRTYF